MSAGSTAQCALDLARDGPAQEESDGASPRRPRAPSFGGIFGRIIVWLFPFALSLLTYLAEGLDPADASWFLQVINRVVAGEVLYRDVFFGATPLSVYVTAALASVLGVEMLTLRVVMALTFVATLLLCCHITRQLGAGHRFPALLVMALFVYGLPWAGAPYSPFSTVFFLACFSAALWWRSSTAVQRESPARPRSALLALAVAGFTAGLSFASKQNVGLFALCALLLAVIAFGAGTPRRPEAAIWPSQSRGRRLGTSSQLFASLAVPGGAFLIASVLALLPVWATGGGPKLVEYGFTNKGAYLAHGQVSYLDGLGTLASLIQNPAAFSVLAPLNSQLMFVLPIAAFIALLTALLRAPSAQRGMAVMVIFFAAAAFAGVFPRADNPHLTYVMPTIVLALAFSWYRIERHLNKRLARLAKAALLLWLFLGLGAMLANPLAATTSAEYRLSDLPHFRGALVAVAKQEEVRENAVALVQAAQGKPLLLLSPFAAQYYLASGLENPIASDFPLVTTFGHNGESEIIAAISEGRIRTVCLDVPRWTAKLRPVLLDRYIMENMDRGIDLGVCTLYHRRP